jgi:hypothetical protein
MKKTFFDMMVTVKCPSMKTNVSEVAIQQSNIDAVFHAINADKTIDLVEVREQPNYVPAAFMTFVHRISKYIVECHYDGSWIVFPLNVEIFRDEQAGDHVISRDKALSKGRTLSSLIRFLNSTMTGKKA